MLANRTSRWSIGAALLCVVLLAASWFLLISPRRADAADVRSQVASTTDQAAQLQVQIAQLKADFADLPKRKAELKAIKQQLPPKANIPSFVRDLRSIAGQAGVSLDSVAPGGPALLAGTAGAGVATDGSVVKIPIAIGITGDYFEASLFLKNLQTKLQRSYLITGLAAVPAPEEETTPAAVVVVPTATSTDAAPATAAATVAPTATAAAVPSLDRVSLAITGAVFVLMDGTTTLEQVTKDAKAAATGKATATSSATSTAPAAVGTASAN